MKNKFGLSRNIPAEIKLKVRQDDGFGCVICGCGIIEYEHIEPEFCDAKVHDPERITLLCPTCHSKVTRGWFDKGFVKEKKANPFTKSQGFTNDFFCFKANEWPLIEIGSFKMKNVPVPIRVNGKNILEIKPPLVDNTPFLLSGIFYDSFNNEVLRIIDNEWRAYNANWDVTVVGSILKIKDKSKVVLELKVLPGSGIIIQVLDMVVDGNKIVANSHKFQVNKSTIGEMFISNKYGGVNITNED